MTGDLVDDLGYTGTTQSCQKVLDGTYEPPEDTNEYTTEYLKHLKKPPNITNPPAAVITTEDYK